MLFRNYLANDRLYKCFYIIHKNYLSEIFDGWKSNRKILEVVSGDNFPLQKSHIC